MVISRRDLEYITQNPLRPILRSFLTAIKENDDKDPRSYKEKKIYNRYQCAVINKLLVDLVNYAIEKDIRSEHDQTLDGQLISLYSSVRNNKISIYFFEPLVKAIYQGCSDIDIWRIIHQLISKVSWSKELPSKIIIHSFNGSSFIPPSASSQQILESGEEREEEYLDWLDEANKYRFLKKQMKKELCDTTFENVGGFWKKYFENKEWVERSTLVFNALNRTHSGYTLPQYPEMYSETTFWVWLDALQTQFLDQLPDSPVKLITGTPRNPDPELPNISRCKYNRLKKGFKEGSGENLWQLDIFSKFRHVPDGRIHHWKDVMVVGVVTSYDITKVWYKMYLRLAVYMREILLAQHLRQFVHGFLLFGTQLQLWVFDHSGSYSSDTIDITKEPERFIRAISGYTYMNDSDLGLDYSLIRRGERTFVPFKDAYTGEDKELEVDPTPIIMRQANDMHGNVCYNAIDGSCMVKFAWRTVTDGPSEVDKFRALQNVEGIPKLLGADKGPTSYQRRSGLKFQEEMMKRIKEDRRQSGSYTDGEEDFDD
ncbi:unnamed protein product [Blumeria hordei]|uniref:Fungal-type protein kinase domain-containing protein n=1 Tax=Blumeria hordei TaxID=2867405 RepID=A0A383UI22_BLUHO|nr:unnamed protein product [Blumeria hordei]